MVTFTFGVKRIDFVIEVKNIKLRENYDVEKQLQKYIDSKYYSTENNG